MIVIELRICLFFSGMVPINRFRVDMFVGATGGLMPEEITFAELLKQKNYSTAFIGMFMFITSIYICYLIFLT